MDVSSYEPSTDERGLHPIGATLTGGTDLRSASRMALSAWQTSTAKLLMRSAAPRTRSRVRGRPRAAYPRCATSAKSCQAFSALRGKHLAVACSSSRPGTGSPGAGVAADPLQDEQNQGGGPAERHHVLPSSSRTMFGPGS